MSSNRKKILWLTSWYPNKYDAFDGDFIQRHACAAARNNDIHVIFVKEGDIKQETAEDWSYINGLTEQVVYFRQQSGPLRKLQKQLIWRKLYFKAVTKYIEKNGRPSAIHVHVPWKAGLIGVEVKNLYKIPLIVSEHWGIYDRVLKDNYFTKLFLFRKAVLRIFKHAKIICLPSKYLGRCIDQIASQTKQVVIPNVVDTNQFCLQEEKFSRFTFIHVSNMEPIKNVTGIIDSFVELVVSRCVTDVDLVLIGNRNEEVKRYAEQTGLVNKNILLKGEVPYSDVARQMQRSHCLIINSLSETFSCVTAEALCCGIPVIARSVGSLPELVDSSNGILLEDHENCSLTEALIQMKECYSQYDLKAISQAAQGKYNYSIIGNLFHQLYSSL